MESLHNLFNRQAGAEQGFSMFIKEKIVYVSYSEYWPKNLKSGQKCYRNFFMIADNKSGFSFIALCKLTGYSSCICSQMVLHK